MIFPFRRRFFWDKDIDEEIRRLEEEIEEEFDKMLESIAEMERYVEKELKEADESKEKFIVRGPFIYGVSIKFGKDGVPIVRKFGNVNIGEALKQRQKESYEGKISVENFAYQREPLVDIIEDDKTIRIIAEVPGVEKNDIKINTTEKILTIDVDTEKRKYHKKINFQCEVIPETAKATYKNGVLEIVIEKKEKENRNDKGVNVEVK